MQSIYRFRDADVSLFIKAREQGLGGVDLQPIALTENHRSAREIVDWVNTAFAGIFPAGKTLGDAVPGFRSAVSARELDASAEVEFHWLEDAGYAAEVTEVISVVKQAMAVDASQSIGILVRSRTHLAGMRAALSEAGLSAEAIEIDSLTDTQLGQDLIGLTSALLHPADRLGWLGVLRSPWCGLGWADLLALGDAGTNGTIWERMGDPACLARLSAAGAERVEWLGEQLARGFGLRKTQSLGRWIRNCWLLIDGPAALKDLRDLEQAERYFSELESLARYGDIDDPAALRSYFSKPAAGVEVPTESGIEIMTMHRAKGLEFDTVILPGLGRTTRGSSSNLLISNDFQLSDVGRISLLAAATKAPEPLVDYLKTIERQRDAAERGRLLYVAATRAKRRLHLIGSVDRDTATPKTGSLLASLWPGLKETPALAPVDAEADAGEVAFIDVALHCLGFDDERRELEPAPETSDEDTAARPDFEWVRPASVQVGTLIHRELQRLAEQAARLQQAVAPRIDIERYRRELALLGVENEDLLAGANRVADALDKVWKDETGRWILKPWPEAWSELRVTIRDGDRLKHIQLDRSFVDADGRRWIIDFKTGQHLGSNVDEFLDSEVDRYRAQLERYAEAVAEFDARPIRVGLYFPLMNALRDWEPALPSRVC
jgi:ATP-dependent exoDNAse (exonuclease V) beta subunit